MVKCRGCGSLHRIVSKSVGYCVECIINDRVDWNLLQELRMAYRKRFNLPEDVPREGNIMCTLCANQCRIPEGGYGFCGLVRNKEGKLIYLSTPRAGLVEWYYDPLPTNCVAEWVCAATGAGYPEFSYVPSIEYGYKNLALFLNACNLDCIFCQNWHYRGAKRDESNLMTAEELASKFRKDVACICWFGGDPSVQMPFALEVSRRIYETATSNKRICRICWETNGLMNAVFAEKATELSYVSGGTMKFDLKFMNENLGRAILSRSQKPSFELFERLHRKYGGRENVPVLMASTLLVPGYMTPEEVGRIASFLASLDENIPFSLLGFCPHYLLGDLPPTSRKEAFECLNAARKAGLKRIRIGNIHLLI